jgi:hypothetical protein
MEEQDVRERAEAVCAALVGGDIERATQDFSEELRRNLGEVLALLPLPSNEATIESIDRGGRSGYTVLLRLVGETEEVRIQTRWKERDGRPTMVEASHLSRAETVVEGDETESEAGDADDAGA